MANIVYDKYKRMLGPPNMFLFVTTSQLIIIKPLEYVSLGGPTLTVICLLNKSIQSSLFLSGS